MITRRHKASIRKTWDLDTLKVAFGIYCNYVFCCYCFRAIWRTCAKTPIHFLWNRVISSVGHQLWIFPKHNERTTACTWRQCTSITRHTMVGHRTRDCRVFQRLIWAFGAFQVFSWFLWTIWKKILIFCWFILHNSVGLQINPNNGIHIDYDKTGRVSGEAFVHFQTNEDCEKAQNLNMQKLGHR